MKKLVAAMMGLSVLLGTAPIGASAEKTEEAVPADIGKAAYDQLMEVSWKYDKNSDNVITMDELKEADLISLDLTGVEDISWLAELDKCTRVLVNNGEITDFSVLKEMDSLTDLFLNKVPIDDISFIKELELDICEITGMPQIDLDKRLAVMRCPDVTVEKGFKSKIGAYPDNILWKHEYKVVIDDESVAENAGFYNSAFGPIRGIYGVSVGETDYHVIVDGEERFKGHITVTEQDVYSPELHETSADIKSDILSWDKAYGVLRNGTLYGIEGKDIKVVDKDVKDFSYASSKASYNQSYTTDLLLKNDGTLYVNKEPVPDQKFESIDHERAVTKDGQLWVPYKIDKLPWVYKIADDFKEFADKGEEFYISKDGEVIWYYYNVDNNNKVETILTPTGIMNPKWTWSSMFIDENDTLWVVSTVSRKADVIKKGENVEKVGDYNTADGMERCYKTLDGKYYNFSGEEVEVTGEYKPTEYSYRSYDSYKMSIYDPASEAAVCLISNDDVLTIEWHDTHFSMSGIEKVLTRKLDKETGYSYMFLLRKDGSIWRYCLDTKEIKEVLTADGEPQQNEEKPVIGDISGDGEFNVADAVTMRSWLLGKPSADIKNWKAADFVDDGVLDTFDYIVMCRKLTE